VATIHKVINNVIQDASWADTASDGVELTGVFWGEQDTTVVNEGGGSVSVYGKGMNYAMFFDTTPDFNAGAGPSAAALSSAIDGTLELTGSGVPLNLAADPNADFTSTYVVSTTPTVLHPLIGVYSSGLSIGVTGPVFLGTGEWNVGLAPGYQVQFTGEPFIDNNTTLWDVVSSDPLRVTAIPTPTAVWGGVLMAGFVGVNVIRRRRAE